ncbi:MAG: hypothetical protein MJY56_04685 [Bacteroidales bacterium]|nr:hypothetical protein [Bacteroidales bacterium]
MKKYLIAIVCCLMALSCAREGTRLYTGSYSFKTSGTITVTGDDGDDLVISLPTESGLMDIVEVDREASTMIVTMNILGGDLVVFDAVAKDGMIELKPSKRHTTLTYAGIDTDNIFDIEGIEDINLEKKTCEADLSIYAEGKKYDDIIIFDFVYNGSIEFDGEDTYKIKESDVKCRAKLNVD